MGCFAVFNSQEKNSCLRKLEFEGASAEDNYLASVIHNSFLWFISLANQVNVGKTRKKKHHSQEKKDA